MWKLISSVAGLGALIAVAWPAPHAAAGAYGCLNGAKYCIVADYCKTKDAYCGGIVYLNKGGYVANPVQVDALSSQPSGATINPACSSIGGTAFKITADTDLGQYEQFVLPADCAYKLKINIKAGNKKDRDLFLTPGCGIEAKTDGTTLSNQWHVSVQWSDAAKKKGASGPVVDGAGNKCGNLSKM